MKQLILRCLYLSLAVFLGASMQAQTVSGTVTEPNGPLPGANVLVKGTSNGATTDFDGNYTLNNVPEGSTLVFSYVGFAEQEIAVNGRTTIDVAMSEDANALDEVVLIGYGQTTVRDATGSVSSVTAEDFNGGVIQSPEQLIQGKTAGVQISESSGEPGAGISVRIRGTNSIIGGSNPLYVVDGVPLNGGSAPSGNIPGIGAGSARNPLNFLNPNDIESISILKDASATAIYGSRGAKGVIIIQTKSGRGSSRGVFEFSSSIAYATPASKYDLANREEFLGGIAAVGNDPAAADFGADSDFQDVYTRSTSSTQNNLSFSKSYNSGNVRASFGYGLTNGIIENSDLERISGRINATQRLFDDKLTFTAQLTYSRINDLTSYISGTVGSTGDLIGSSITANPTFPIDPEFNPGSNILNPANLLANYRGLSNTDRYLGNLSAEYKITDELSAKATVGYDGVEAETTYSTASSIVGINSSSNIGRGQYLVGNQKNRLLEGTLNYTKEFGNSVLDVVGGYQYQEFQSYGFGSEGAGFATTDLDEMAQLMRDAYSSVTGAIQGSYSVFGYGTDGTYLNRLFPEINTTDVLPGGFNRPISAYILNYNYNNTDELQSYFVRANYTIAEKYLFTGTFRADGSSKFGNNERYGYFPSGAFAWQLHKEDFIGDAFSTLKLRLGAGIVGSQDGLSYGQFIFRTVAAGGGISNDLLVLPSKPGTAIAGGFPNPDLKWQETTDYNVGVDFGFNNDRFNGTVNFYRKDTKDLLLTTQLAAPGSGTIFRNLPDGSLINQGVELSLNYDFINTDDFTFSGNFNVSYNANDVKDVSVPINAGPINGNGLTNAFAQRLEAGQPLFSYYMAEFTGFDANGNPTYFDFDGDGVGDPDADKFFVGKDAVADWTGGLNLSARYKNFDVTTYFTGQFGFYVYNATDNAFFTKSALLIGKNVTRDVLGTSENAGSTVAVSTRFLEKGDFVRMQNATLGYNVPLSGENLFKSMRLSLTGQNLFLLTGYSGLDPEVSVGTGNLNASNIPTAGIDYASYPRPITVTFGLNATF